MTKKMKTLPDKIYVRIEDVGDGTTYLEASEDFSMHANIDKKVTIGVYELTSVKAVECKPTLL